ncbi:MAG: helix-turn-helix transcriptional regulator [Terracidiphilus sp.]|jgi:transcriptional regulator with XRE-family HTH domain
MKKMSREKKMRAVLDPELRDKIRALRDSLGVSQRHFAERVNVRQTQISAWERGAERPSADSLIALGNITENLEDQIWFWKKAGCDEKKMRGTLSREALARLRAPQSERCVEVELVEELTVDSQAKLLKVSRGGIFLPTEPLGAAPFICCLKLDDSFRKYALFSVGDVLIIDQSPIDPREHLGSLTAIFFERRPEYEGVPLTEQEWAEHRGHAKHVSQEERAREDEALRRFDPEAFADQKASDQRAHERASKLTEKFMACPQTRVGWLRLESAGERRPENWLNELSRFVLDLLPSQAQKAGPRIPLTDWLKGLNPSEADVVTHLSRSTHIVGRVVGWIQRGSPLAEKAARL